MELYPVIMDLARKRQGVWHGVATRYMRTDGLVETVCYQLFVPEMRVTWDDMSSLTISTPKMDLRLEARGLCRKCGFKS
jgi:hypothetical protein